MINKFFQLFFTICLCTIVSQAQTSTGNLMLGGHFYSKISKQEKIFIIDASPDFGVFVNDHLAVGGNMDFGIARYGTNHKHQTLGLLPSARYFFGQQKAGRVFVHGEAGYHRVNISIGDVFIARSGLGGGAGIGVAYFFNPSVSVEGMFRMRVFRYTDRSTALQNSLRVGIQLYIPSHRIR